MEWINGFSSNDLLSVNSNYCIFAQCTLACGQFRRQHSIPNQTMWNKWDGEHSELAKKKINRWNNERTKV